MFAFIKEKYLRLLDGLDYLSFQVRRYSYNFGPVVAKPPLLISSDLRLRWAFAIEATLAFILFATLATYSRMAQYDFMTQNIADYFLPNLTIVSTTNDSGYYFSSATTWLNFDFSHRSFAEHLKPGDLLGFSLGMVAKFGNLNLSDAAIHLVIGCVTLTSFAAYLFLSALNQSSLGFFVGAGMIFFFPVYSRTSLGMVDTDLLNLFFVLVIPSAFAMAASSKSLRASLIWIAISSAFIYLFYLWYNRPGFFPAYFSIFILLMLASRKPTSHLMLGSLMLLVFALPYQASSVYSSLKYFLDVYVFAMPIDAVNERVSDGTISGFSSLVYSTIGEKQSLSVQLIENDFGHWIFFCIALLGMGVWFAQGWTRMIAAAIPILFLLLYLNGGQRFSFYAAPLFLIGLATLLSSVLVKPLLKVKSVANFSNSNSLIQNGKLVEPSGKGNGGPLIAYQQLSLLSILLLLAWPTGIFPPAGITPPPVIRGEEVHLIKTIVERYSHRPIVIVSWWDYGHELEFQTQRPTLTSGTNPAAIQNLYIARALVETDSRASSDELRFATYFSGTDLSESFPGKPALEKAVGIDRDIFLFLPSDLKGKIGTVASIARRFGGRGAETVGNRPEKTAFHILFNESPESWGPFKRLYKQEGGAAIYVLPGLIVGKQ